MERVDSLESVEISEKMVTRTIDFSTSALRGHVNYECEMVVFNLEFAEWPKAG